MHVQVSSKFLQKPITTCLQIVAILPCHLALAKHLKYTSFVQDPTQCGNVFGLDESTQTIASGYALLHWGAPLNRPDFVKYCQIKPKSGLQNETDILDWQMNPGNLGLGFTFWSVLNQGHRQNEAKQPKTTKALTLCGRSAPHASFSRSLLNQRIPHTCPLQPTYWRLSWQGKVLGLRLIHVCHHPLSLCLLSPKKTSQMVHGPVFSYAYPIAK